MGCNTSDLRNKEVINICDCRKFGYVCDFEIDPCSGRLIAIYVPAETGIFGFGKGNIIRIDWCDITKIGDDIILVNVSQDKCTPCSCEFPKQSSKKKGFFF